MNQWLGDATLDHLRDVAEWPDLGPRYEVKGRLGRGGMGAVFEAYDRALDRAVAVKVMDRPGWEAKVLAQLEHPGIVPVHDAGALPDGRTFYVMKRVRGARLNEALSDSVSTAQRLDLFRRICDAVAFAHAHGVFHRDLKPENIMLGPFGEVLVMDWGIAARAESAAENHVIAGTPGYMSPEQAAGAVAADARVDVFGLGALLAAILRPPVPRPLAAIADRARAQDPVARYPSVEALAKEIERFREGKPVDAYRENVTERLLRLYNRYQLPIILVLVYMIVRVILLLWLRI
jgi:serine/threonine protein kinase